MEWAGMDENTPIENAMVSRTIRSTQERVEGYNFDMRKHLVEYDDVVNKQRELIYTERRKILSGADLKTNILSLVEKELQQIIDSHIGDGRGDGWDAKALTTEVSTIFALPPTLNDDSLSRMKTGEIEDKLIEYARALYEEREREMGSDNMRLLERLLMLRIIDSLWVEHLTAMEQMRLDAGWQTLRQVKAVDAYKREGYNQFQILLSTIQHDVAQAIYHASINRHEAPPPSPMVQVTGNLSQKANQKPRVSSHKVGRNQPCPCGSGKKYKHCCGK